MLAGDLQLQSAVPYAETLTDDNPGEDLLVLAVISCKNPD
jgi:hypothetical protein